MTTTATPTSIPMTDITAKARLLRGFEREHACTLKVLRAFPPDQADFKPHDRSNSARRLAATFVAEQRLMLRALKGEPVLSGSVYDGMPQEWNELLDSFEQTGQEVIELLRNPENASLAGTATFFVAPKQTGEFPLEGFVEFMLHDQIHHRGQMSVYVRMAGGKVPSIYGPSADEPWH
jgi:uncharacterized damage-inducible protein DinB